MRLPGPMRKEKQLGNILGDRYTQIRPGTNQDESATLPEPEKLDQDKKKEKIGSDREEKSG